MKITFTNPRTTAEFDDWPIGGKLRGKCKLYVEHDAKRGYRVCRQTQDKHGKWCKPKTTTFSGPVVIADGSNGRTYILEIAKHYGFVSIRRHDFMCASKEELGRDHSVFQDTHPDLDPEAKELHAELTKFILSGQDAATFLYPNRNP